MILTNCAACAAPLAHDAPRCVRCWTRYCSAACLNNHAHRGGHDDECEEIANGGGAEQHHANKKYDEAVADAVEECAEDTAGQTCYICLEDGSEEGLVRGCSCRGASGFVHVSCLARQAQVLVAEAEERNLDDDAFNARWRRWDECRLCEQDYHGVVRCALGWACWKTYVGRPEGDPVRGLAMNLLGNGLSMAGYHADALSVKEALLSLMRRVGATEDAMLVARGNLANTYHVLGRLEEALSVRREVYSGRLKLDGREQVGTLRAANNYADSLVILKRFKEARSLLRQTMPVAQRVLGEGHGITLRMRWTYADALYLNPGATLDDLREAVTTLEEAGRIGRRVLGGAHPTTGMIEASLRKARAALSARDGSSLSEAFAAMTPSQI